MRRKLHSHTLIGLTAQDALRRKAELDGEPPPRSSVPDQDACWPPRWQAADDLQNDETQEDWCASLRSGVQRSEPAPPPSLEATAPPEIPGTRHPSTDAVFVATLAPPEAPASRLPVIALLGAALASVVAMAVLAVVKTREEGPLWRLAQTLPDVTLEERAASDGTETERSATPEPDGQEAGALGMLVVDAGPRGCDLWINGVGRAVRGRTVLRLPVGPHSIACRRTGKLEGRRVVVSEGKSAFVRFSR